jgi:pimeloyl-ACP methyl ester carboxylesterase
LKIYCIPGLGFDHRIFANLALEPHEVEFIDWLEPERDESLSAYVERMAEPIDDGEGPVALVGHSFGGVVGQEIARIRDVSCVVLLASIRARRENPLPFRLLKPLGLHVLFRKGLVEWGLGPFGAICDYERGAEQDLVRDMVRRHSNHYLSWALGRLSEWKPGEMPERTRVVQIHGDRDITFPLRRILHPDHVLSRAGHFFVYKRGEELTPLIRAAVGAAD